jgi:hypothetical protein
MNLGPTAVRSVARMTLSADLYTQLEQAGGIGDRSGDGSQADWQKMMEHLRELLQCTSANLKIGLVTLR